jgi:hypothetical protein
MAHNLRHVLQDAGETFSQPTEPLNLDAKRVFPWSVYPQKLTGVAL